MEWLTTTGEVLKALGFEHIKLISIIIVIFCPISFVYALGRGLNILHTKLQKNIFAISSIIVFSTLEVFDLIPLRVQSLLFLLSLGFFIYVVLWQKFYSRSDKYLDRKLGDDEEENNNGFVVKKRKK